ncbi:PLP-dependent aminotransferase family protein [Phycicoccus sp. BSK3Z-2]|uniref:PLP-dependent aminotransferase family protein n=1 Tax=Phycicoccus avicenniae TaxID=2828860 RepID=A0A941HYE9_9MICO|nr:PLP-dependent aminotransferase family protein [Phycicoccus avicenniae]MBR7742883.1 PLP-dependent aminotransferase family protein [Phycicoccus avicenniae]
MASPAPTVSATRTARLVGDVTSTRPVYRALADALRLTVADGRIAPGTRLPSERDLTHALGLSRTTVTRAYDVLRDTGYLRSVRGSGSVATLPTGVVHRGSGGLFPGDVADGVLDLTCAAPRAPAGIVEAYERAVERLPSYLGGTGYLTYGLPELREALAERYTARGVPTRAEDVLVTSGAVAGLGVVLRALVSPGDRVLVEDPTYPNTLDLLRGGGARLRTLPVDPDGWDLDDADRVARSAAARAAVLVPDFHNPTGALLDDEGRARLAAALRSAGTVPVVDETIAEIDLIGGPMALPLAAHAPEAVSVGSASKSHWGGLRTGWVRAPHGRMRDLVEARVASDLGAPVLEQLVHLELLRACPGLTEDRRTDLVAARDAAATALRAQLPEVRFTPARGGLSLWCELPPGTSASRVAVAAEPEGLLLAPGPRFAVEGGLDRWLRLPHVLPAEAMTDAVGRLARAVHAVAGRGPDPADRRRPVRPLVA